MLGELAFATEENGQFGRARDLAEYSLAGNPMNGFAAHSLAHVYLETADLDQGTTWLGSWLSDWERPSPFACHLTWHLALLRLAAGDIDGAVRLLSDILGYTGRSVGVLADGSSLAWRLKLDGVGGDLPWSKLAQLPDRPGFSFANAHHVLALAGAGQTTEILAYAEVLDNLATGGHPSAGICAEFARGLSDLLGKHYESAADRLMALLPRFRSLGGSHAQTEVFEDTTIAAQQHAGRFGIATGLLKDRLARRHSRRDEGWLERLATSPR